MCIRDRIGMAADGEHLNPDAEEFWPGEPYGYGESAAPVMSITDEILYGKKSDQSCPDPRLRPEAEEFSPGRPFGLGPVAPTLGVTDELLDPPVDEDTAVPTPVVSPMGHGDFGTAISTPVSAGRGRPVLKMSPLLQRGPRLTNRDWSYMPGRRNTDEGEISLVPEINKKKTGLRWKQVPSNVLKFVDDGMILTKACMDSAVESIRDGRSWKTKHDVQSQNLFRRIVRRAESRGMMVNKSKTKMLCVSDTKTYMAEAFILDGDGHKTTSGGGMKVLGYHIDSRPTAHAHVRALQVRMRDTVWILRHLGLASFTKEELARVYKTIVRPVLDYCAVIYHPMLTDEQDQQIERLQAQALKSIYGYKESYARMREMAGVSTHRARRIDLCDTFAKKAAANPRFLAWFPERTARSGRHGEQYRELNARTDRLFNSPIFYYRRRLNGKPGKVYGQRNKEYRDG